MGWAGRAVSVTGSCGNHHSKIRISRSLWAGISGGQRGSQSVPARSIIPELTQRRSVPGIASGTRFQECGSNVFSPEVAYVITNILADPAARLLTFGNPGYFDFGFPVAVKTGTSSNYRDAWAIAYTSEHVIGIWAGNFDGRPSPGRMGAGVCGPMLFEIIRFLYGTSPPEAFSRPVSVREETVCSMSGKRAVRVVLTPARRLCPVIKL